MGATGTPTWDETRAAVLRRDGSRCTVGWLLGGACHETLDVDHLVPRDEGGTDALDNLITVCHSHHPMREAVRKAVLHRRGRLAWRRCTHVHPYAGGREDCERRLNRVA